MAENKRRGDQETWSRLGFGEKPKKRIFTVVKAPDIDFKGTTNPLIVRLAEGKKGYEVKFGGEDNSIKISSYTLRGPEQIQWWSEGRDSPDFGFNGIKKVGDYDDWQIKEAVEFAAKQQGITIPEDAWFKEK